MAADVVTPQDAGIDPPRRLRSEARAERRRIWMVRRMAKATSADEQLTIAIDYFRATALDHKIAREAAEAATLSFVQQLIDRADALAKPRRRKP